MPAGGISNRAMLPPWVMCHSARTTAPHGSPRYSPDSFTPVKRSRHSRSQMLSARPPSPRRRRVGTSSQTALGTVAGTRCSSSAAAISHTVETMAGVRGRSDRIATALDGTVISLIRQHYETQLVVVNTVVSPLRDVVATPPGCCRYPSGMLSSALRDVVVKPPSVSVGCRGERSDTRHATPDTAAKLVCEGGPILGEAQAEPDPASLLSGRAVGAGSGVVMRVTLPQASKPAVRAGESWALASVTLPNGISCYSSSATVRPTCQSGRKGKCQAVDTTDPGFRNTLLSRSLLKMSLFAYQKAKDVFSSAPIFFPVS